jgi:hypothetical protein
MQVPITHIRNARGVPVTEVDTITKRMFIRIIDPEGFTYLVESETVHAARVWADENLDYYNYECEFLHITPEHAVKKIEFGIPVFVAPNKPNVARKVA